jgi:hypothetical protein
MSLWEIKNVFLKDTVERKQSHVPCGRCLQHGSRVSQPQQTPCCHFSWYSPTSRFPIPHHPGWLWTLLLATPKPLLLPTLPCPRGNPNSLPGHPHGQGAHKSWLPRDDLGRSLQVWLNSAPHSPCLEHKYCSWGHSSPYVTKRIRVNILIVEKEGYRWSLIPPWGNHGAIKSMPAAMEPQALHSPLLVEFSVTCSWKHF